MNLEHRNRHRQLISSFDTTKKRAAGTSRTRRGYAQNTLRAPPSPDPQRVPPKLAADISKNAPILAADNSKTLQNPLC